jgi:hypothetical protein
MGHIIKVIIKGENVERFEKLQNSTSEDRQNYENLLRAIEKLKTDPYRGRSVRKRQIPDKYKNCKNLWRDKLTKSWRYLFTVKNLGEDPDTGTEIIEVTIVDWMHHKEYDRLFGYD